MKEITVNKFGIFALATILIILAVIIIYEVDRPYKSGSHQHSSMSVAIRCTKKDGQFCSINTVYFNDIRQFTIAEPFVNYLRSYQSTDGKVTYYLFKTENGGNQCLGKYRVFVVNRDDQHLATFGSCNPIKTVHIENNSLVAIVPRALKDVRFQIDGHGNVTENYVNKPLHGPGYLPGNELYSSVLGKTIRSALSIREFHDKVLGLIGATNYEWLLENTGTSGRFTPMGEYAEAFGCLTNSCGTDDARIYVYRNGNISVKMRSGNEVTVYPRASTSKQMQNQRSASGDVTPPPGYSSQQYDALMGIHKIRRLANLMEEDGGICWGIAGPLVNNNLSGIILHYNYGAYGMAIEAENLTLTELNEIYRSRCED